MNVNASAKQLNSKIVKRMLQVVIQMLVIVAILFISAGRLDWIWVWIYLGVGAGILVVNAFVLSPELIAERGQPKENVKGWDKLLTTFTIFPTLGMLAVIGLDERFAWSPDLALGIHLAALVVMALGQGLFTWAMVSNKFFSTLVRIQIDRDHTVATDGPYRYVRHPGYVGHILSNLATPLIFGSLWGLILAGLIACLFILRTALEDKTLREELDGYQDYAQQVRYRLLPWIW